MIGVFGWCQMILFFTYCPPHALQAAQITSKWKCRIFFFDYGFISTFASNASLVARRLVNHRVFGYSHNQSKFAASRCWQPRSQGLSSSLPFSRSKEGKKRDPGNEVAMLTPLGIFVYFEVNYTRVTPRQRSSFQESDWLVWQLRDCVWVFFHVEVDVLESSARSKSCWLEQTSYRRFWSDSSKYSGRTPNVTCCCQQQIQCPNKEHHRNWPFLTQPPL